MAAPRAAQCFFFLFFFFILSRFRSFPFGKFRFLSLIPNILNNYYSACAVAKEIFPFKVNFLIVLRPPDKPYLATF